MEAREFSGFTGEAFDFLEGLSANNNREWFDAQKSTYKTALLEPAVALVATLGERLRAEFPHVRYDTRTNGSGSLMRIYRDVRFSEDKSPYKTQIAMMFPSGEGKKMKQPGFGLQLSVRGVELMAGLFRFEKEGLQRYRVAVDDQQSGAELVRACERVCAEEGYRIEGQTYKRVPRGFDTDHPRGAFLRHSGLYASAPPIAPGIVRSPELIDEALARFRHMAPVEEWLVRSVFPASS